MFYKTCSIIFLLFVHAVVWGTEKISVELPQQELYLGEVKSVSYYVSGLVPDYSYEVFTNFIDAEGLLAFQAHHLVPFNSTNDNEQINYYKQIATPKDIAPGRYTAVSKLYRKLVIGESSEQSNSKLEELSTNNTIVTINATTFSNTPQITSIDLSQSRVFVADKEFVGEVSYLAPLKGMPSHLIADVVLTSNDSSFNIIKHLPFTLKAIDRVGIIKLPIKFKLPDDAPPGSYKISLQLSSNDGLFGLMNQLNNYNTLAQAHYDLGTIHIVRSTPLGAQHFKVFNVAEFGAHPDDGIDDSSAIHKAINALRKNGGGILKFAAGAYEHNRAISVSNLHDFTIDGNRTKLIATNLEESTIEFKNCSNFSFRNFDILSPDTSKRQQAFIKNGITVVSSQNFSISNNAVYYSAAAGILIAGNSKYYTIENNTVINTWADAIHNTGASAYAAIYSNTTHGNGDDGIAVVSYFNKYGDTHNISLKTIMYSAITWERYNSGRRK